MTKYELFSLLLLQKHYNHMKRNPKIDDVVFDKWKNGLSFRQLSEIEFESDLPLHTIRNIVYRFRSEHAQHIYSLFKLKFLELQDVNAAIKFVHENKPKFTVSERTIRRVVSKKLHEHKKNSPNQPKN